MRYGNRTALGRHWTACGHRPSGVRHIGYDYGYLYAALCPKTGDLFALLLPTMESACYEVFLKELHRQLTKRGQRTIQLVMDNAGTHQSLQFKRPTSIQSLYLPAYSIGIGNSPISSSRLLSGTG